MKYALLLFFFASQTSDQSDVLCIGDSITHGWARHTVWTCPRDNCRSTRYGLSHLAEWTGSRSYRVIVFNFGIWDCKEPRTPIEEYRHNLNEIIDRLKADRIYFCTTTPGHVGEHQGVTPEVVERYNAAALEVMKARGIRVIDLHRLTAQHPAWRKKDGIHYTEDGYEHMALYIKDAIR